MSCSITFNTKDNRETHRYEVWCSTRGGEDSLIGWVADTGNTECIEGIIELMGGSDIEFRDTEAEPIGGGE